MRRYGIQVHGRGDDVGVHDVMRDDVLSERKGNNSTPVETLPLVLDCLLLMPGVIPGVIALVIDFGTGAIYTEKRGQRETLLDGGGRALFRATGVEPCLDRGGRAGAGASGARVWRGRDRP